MLYEARNYDSLLGLEGFSDTLLKNHFTLYQGYVANVNKLVGILKAKLEAGETTTPEYGELKRRFGWEFNGMRLHELYFGNMAKKDSTDGTLDESSELYKKITKDFGSFEKWISDFKATGAMRGIGWIILLYDKEQKCLLNVWINEHDVGHLVGVEPLLVMDVFEHAFMLDYGLKRADYISAFWKAISWEEVMERFSPPM